MQISNYRQNVMRTLSPKKTKLALKHLAKNTTRSTIAFASLALASATGDVLTDLTPYILGEKLTEDQRNTATVSFGSVGYALIILAKTLKVKTPTASKKAKLTGTRTAALLQFNMLVNRLTNGLGNQLAGPMMKQEEREVVLPQKGGIKEMRMVDILDKEGEATAEEFRMGDLKATVESLVDLYWRLVFDTFGFAPETILQAQFDSFKNSYPEGTFTEKAEDVPNPSAAQPAIK